MTSSSKLLVRLFSHSALLCTVCFLTTLSGSDEVESNAVISEVLSFTITGMLPDKIVPSDNCRLSDDSMFINTEETLSGKSSLSADVNWFGELAAIGNPEAESFLFSIIQN